MVARIIELCRVKPEFRILDIGAGSGYLAALLSLLCRQVYAMEIIPTLAEASILKLRHLGYDNVQVVNVWISI